MGKAPKLYINNNTTIWIGEDEDGSLFEFPAQADGWEKRKPYPGPRGGLREAPAYNAIGTGWPGFEIWHKQQGN